MPDVLVLVLSGAGPVDEVSINYSSPVPDQAVKADIQALARNAAWLVGEEKVTTRTVADRKITSGSFKTMAAINYNGGTVPVAPFVLAFKRYRSIELNYLVPKRFHFRGLKDFENDFVKVNLEERGSSLLYHIRVKNNHFDRLVLPATQPKAPAKEVRRLGAAGRLAGVAMFALVSALVAYFGARAVYRRRGAG